MLLEVNNNMGSLQGTCHLSQMKMPTNLEHPIAYGFKICPLAGRRWQVKVAVWRWKRKVEVRRKKMKVKVKEDEPEGKAFLK